MFDVEYLELNREEWCILRRAIKKVAESGFDDDDLRDLRTFVETALLHLKKSHHSSIGAPVTCYTVEFIKSVLHKAMVFDPSHASSYHGLLEKLIKT